MARLQQPPVPTDAEHMQDYLINWNAGPLGVVLQPDLGADMPPVVAQMLPQPSVLKMAGVREGDLLISINGKKTTRLGYEKVIRLLFKEHLPMVLHFRSPLPVSEALRCVLGSIPQGPLPMRSHGRSRYSNAIQTKSPNHDQGRSDVEPKRKPKVHIAANDSELFNQTEKTKQNKSKHNGYDNTKAEAEEKRLRKQYSAVWERGSLGISFRAYNSKVNVPCVDFVSANRGQGRSMDRVCINDVLIAINGEKTKALGVEKVLRWLHVIEKPVVLRFHASSNRIKHRIGSLLPQVAEEVANVPMGPRLPTIVQPQPEYEHLPRPPRRNNSVDQSVPQQQIEQSSHEGNEIVRHLARSSSQESATFFEKQPIEDNEMKYLFDTATSQVKEAHISNSVMHAEAKGRGDRGVAGDFRREPRTVKMPELDVRMDGQIVPHRRQSCQVETQSSQPRELLLSPLKPRARSASRDMTRCQQPSESKLSSLPTTSDAATARSRVASRDSQTSISSQLSLKEAADIVARATGKAVEKCEFGGIPLLDIKEGSVQAKLMYIYAKACLVKEINLDNHLSSQAPQQPQTSDPLGRMTYSKYLSYTILQSDSCESNYSATDKIGHTCDEVNIEPMVNGLECMRSGVFSDNLTESLARMQKDISVQPPTPPGITTSFSSAGSAFSASSDVTPSVAPAPHVILAEDFISLNDFIVRRDGKIMERCTTSSLGSTVSVAAADEIYIKATDARGNLIQATHVEEVVAEVSKECVANKYQTLDLNDTLDAKPLKSEDKVKQMQGRAEALNETIELEGDVHADVNATSKLPFDERDLGDSVASLDNLFDLRPQDSDHVDEKFVDEDDDETKDKDGNEDDEKDFLRKSLMWKLDQVQEEENGETADSNDSGHGKLGELEYQNSHRKEEMGKVKERQGKNDYEESALSNVLVDELYRDVQDIRRVIQDKSALLVLVKKSMIDEIQEILQSLQTELQLERHSTMAVGSPANPLQDSQPGQSTEGEHCFQCGAAGELAELDVGGGRRELYCEECWELFFFSEENQSPVTRPNKLLAPSAAEQLTADEDALDEALKYSFHDSSITREDIVHPWRSLQGSDSISSSFRDSNELSITDRADEVWL